MTDSIHAAFAAAYQQIENPKKNATNPAFRSGYANLEEVLAQVKGALSEHNLTLIQQSVSDEHGIGVITYVMDEKGDTISFGTLTLPLAKNDPQGAGSALTYARRYALKSIFGLAEVDDDGNSASRVEPQAKPKPQPSSEPTGWAAIVASYKEHGTRDEVLKALGNPTSGDAAIAAYDALSKPKKASLALIAVGAAVS